MIVKNDSFDGKPEVDIHSPLTGVIQDDGLFEDYKLHYPSRERAKRLQIKTENILKQIIEEIRKEEKDENEHVND